MAIKGRKNKQKSSIFACKRFDFCDGAMEIDMAFLRNRDNFYGNQENKYANLKLVQD